MFILFKFYERKIYQQLLELMVGALHLLYIFETLEFKTFWDPICETYSTECSTKTNYRHSSYVVFGHVYKIYVGLMFS